MHNITIISLVICFSIATNLSGAELKFPFETTSEYVIHTPLPSLADEIYSFQNPGAFLAATDSPNEDHTVLASHARSTYFLQGYPPPQNPKVVLIVLGVAVGFLLFIYILFH